MVALPVVQVLRFQAEQIEALVRHRTTLNPMVRAAEVQRGLLAHRDLSAQVLRGRDAMEAPRQQRQLFLDQGIRTLVADLGALHLHLAVREAQTLHDDFVSLAAQVSQRRLSAPDSNAGHRLLVEQTLQVMDLAQELSDDVTTRMQDADTRLALTLTRELPRAAWQLGQSGVAVEVAAAQALRLQRLSDRHGLVTHRAATSSSSSPLAQAMRAASTSLQAWTALALTSDAQDASAEATRAAALVAQWQLYDVAHATASHALSHQLATAQTRQLQWLAGLLALALLAAGLLARLWALCAAPSTPPTAPQAAADEAPDHRRERPAGGAHDEAQVLLQRLRWAEAALNTGKQVAPAAEPQPRESGH